MYHIICTYTFSGASVLTSNRGRVHSFPYDVENPTGPPRDIREHQKDAQDSINEGSPVS